MDNKLEIYKKNFLFELVTEEQKKWSILLSSFVNKFIHTFDKNLLLELEKF